MSSESPVLVLYLQRVGAQPLVSLPVTEALNGRGNQCRPDFHSTAQGFALNNPQTQAELAPRPPHQRNALFSHRAARVHLWARASLIFSSGALCLAPSFPLQPTIGPRLVPQDNRFI